jgi:hypothetical protein
MRGAPISRFLEVVEELTKKNAPTSSAQDRRRGNTGTLTDRILLHYEKVVFQIACFGYNSLASASNRPPDSWAKALLTITAYFTDFERQFHVNNLRVFGGHTIFRSLSRKVMKPVNNPEEVS